MSATLTDGQTTLYALWSMRLHVHLLCWEQLIPVFLSILLQSVEIVPGIDVEEVLPFGALDAMKSIRSAQEEIAHRTEYVYVPRDVLGREA